MNRRRALLPAGFLYYVLSRDCYSSYFALKEHLLLRILDVLK